MSIPPLPRLLTNTGCCGAFFCAEQRKRYTKKATLAVTITLPVAIAASFPPPLEPALLEGETGVVGAMTTPL